MSSQITAGLIIGAAIIIAAGMWIYFSPLQTCIRAQMASETDLDSAAYAAEKEDVVKFCVKEVGKN